MKATLQTVILLFFVTVIQFANAQQDTTKSVLEKGLDQYKLQKAKHLLYNYDYEGALIAYEELYTENPDNLIVQYRIGQVHYKLRDYVSAVKFMGMAIEKEPEVDKEAFYEYTKALHRIGKFDEAQTQLEIYWKTLKASEGSPAIPNEVPQEESLLAAKLGKAENDRVKEVILMNKGLTFAKQAIENPYQVTIDNMGTDINSSFDDYGASISANEKTIIFTARRPDTKGGAADPNDGKYMEDIYIAEWNEEEGKWNKAETIKGRLNTEYHDACLSIRLMGNEFMYIKILVKVEVEKYMFLS
ncbi:MAG: hypothetical protein JKY53_03485 [Flavobacteriales bacterium]|nr:hypothetical protein [Flavobacteriales bacterium]